MKRKMEKSELIFKIIAYFFLILFALMCVYPLIYALASMFSSDKAIIAGKVVLWPVVDKLNAEGNTTYSIGFSFDAIKYAAVTEGNKFWISYANTLFVCFIGTIWCLVYSVLGAYALSKKRIMGRKGWNFFLVFTMWFSAGIIPQYNNYVRTQSVMATLTGMDKSALDLKWLIILAMGMNATNIILLRNTFEGVPSEIEEAARIDGATEMQVLWNVYIPMSKATIATVALFFGISRWNGYFWAKQVIPDTDDQRYQWPVQVYIRAFLERWTTLTGVASNSEGDTWNEPFSAVAVAYSMVVCGVIPILVIYPFIQKYFAKGVNMGGVKE